MNKLLPFIFIAPFLLNAKEERSIFVTTSPPDHSFMKLVTTDSYAKSQLIRVGTTRSKEGQRYISFEEAYSDFFDELVTVAKERSKKYNMDGACNIKVTYQVTEEYYYFAGTYDYWQR
ncbi:hypothetical protein [Pseudoalteromonas sp. S16_S37]|uniref:hypothetical protein n=1 Tax=Pseudoalteromonas sp. S16_S37 TaxID=2720228 RepID=UPI00168071A3|nr:hypothetical protein [Pseudoalteromonas sp. S16_S37]MBD1583454.1 hypothetical protein [Pseudoalteromonas sp. S16_S37]